MSDKELEEQMAGIARSVAVRYCARCWWANPADLEQQAWIAVLEVRQYYANGNEQFDRAAFGGIAHTAALRQLSRYLWKESSPVSAYDKEVAQMRGMTRAAVDPRLPDESRDPEQELQVERFKDEEIRLLLKIEERICTLYSRMPWYKGPDVWLEACIEIFVKGRSPREAAHDLCVDVRSVYKTTEPMRVVMRKDRKLHEYLLALRHGRNEVK